MFTIIQSVGSGVAVVEVLIPIIMDITMVSDTSAAPKHHLFADDSRSRAPVCLEPTDWMSGRVAESPICVNVYVVAGGGGVSRLFIVPNYTVHIHIYTHTAHIY